MKKKKRKMLSFRITEELYNLIEQQNEDKQVILNNSIKSYLVNPIEFTKEEIMNFHKRKRKKTVSTDDKLGLKEDFDKIDPMMKGIVVDYAVRRYLGEGSEDEEEDFEEDVVIETPFNGSPEIDEKEDEDLFFDHTEINLTDLIIYICDKCNMSCKHCYLSKGDTTINPEWIEWLVQNFPTIKKCIIVGGEPTICSELPTIAKILHDVGAHVAVSTNCKWIEKEKDIPHILRYLTDVDAVQISIEGREQFNDFIRAPGSFKNSIEAAKILKHNKFDVALRMTYSQLNLEEVPHILKIAAEEGYRAYLFPYKGDDIPPLTAEQQEWLYNLLVDFTSDNGDRMALAAIPQYMCYMGEWDYCPAGKERINIMPDGLITPCEMSTPPNHFPLARFKTDGYQINGEKQCMDKEFLLKRMRFFLTTLKQPDMDCTSCKYFRFCRSGCLQTKEYMNCPLKDMVDINYYRGDMGISRNQIKTRARAIVKNVAERIGC